MCFQTGPVLVLPFSLIGLQSAYFWCFIKSNIVLLSGNESNYSLLLIDHGNSKITVHFTVAVDYFFRMNLLPWTTRDLLPRLPATREHFNAIDHVGFLFQNACTSSPCQNNGTCVPLFSLKITACLCSRGFAGKYCGRSLQNNLFFT